MSATLAGLNSSTAGRGSAGLPGGGSSGGNVPPTNALMPMQALPSSEGAGAGDPRLMDKHTGPRKPLLQAEISERFARWMTLKNIADDLDDDMRGKIAHQALDEYRLDDTSRSSWKSQYRKWLDFAMQVAEAKSYPWPNASNVVFPLITVSALQFNARAYPAIVMGRNVVKASVVGNDRGTPQLDETTGQPQVGPDGSPMWIVPPGAKQMRADKIGQHMSWQLLNEQPEWESQTDRMLILLAVVGTMFRKNYFDPAGLRNVSETVDALRLVVDYHAKSFDVVPRITEEIDFYPWEIETNKRSGLWLDHEYGKNAEASQDQQAPVTFCEQHRRFDLDGDGYDEPLIVTFARDSGALARITVGFGAEDVEATHDGRVQKIKPIQYYTKYGFIPNPDSGAYDIGFGHLMMPLNASVNTSINQLFDAGHLQITGGGFIGGNMSLNTGSVRFTTGEYKVVNTPGKTLRDNLVPLQFPGPNPVLMELMKYLVDSAKDIGSIKDVLTGDLPGANIPGILGLAVIQQGLKVFNAIFKRVHRSLRADYQKLFRLNRLYLPENAGYQIGSEYFEISRKDYEQGAGVEPFSDADMVTDTQQMAHANFLLSFKDDPFFNQRELRLRALLAAATPQIDKLLVDQAPPNAAIAAQLAELDLEKRVVDLRKQELDIRAAHQEAMLDIRRGKDKASEIRDLSQALLNLANARKADSDVDVGWYAQQLKALELQIDILNRSAESEPPGDSPAAAAGIGGAAAPGALGPAGAGVPGMAPSPGQPSGADLLGGLSQ